MTKNDEPTPAPVPMPAPAPTPAAAKRVSKDPLHGMTLETILNRLVSEYGWEELGRMIRIRCFQSDPSISSSLKFLRKTPWARKKVESLFVALPTRYLEGKK